MKLVLSIAVLFVFLCGNSAWGDDSARGNDPVGYRSWVKNMKTSARGPFSRIQWFCQDGTILAPGAYACQDHGGGVQHGLWTPEVTQLRAKGYFIATVYADLIPHLFMGNQNHLQILKQMMLEQFLISADDGWIFRHARYYRGALQTEDETASGQNLLKALLNAYGRSPEKFLLIREAVRLLPHHHQNAPVSQMRQLSLAIADADKNFMPLRTKIHVRPDKKDAHRVRMYAKKNGLAELSEDYELLAKTIDAVFQPTDLTPILNHLVRQTKGIPIFGQVQLRIEKLTQETDPIVRFKIAAHLSRSLRQALYLVKAPDTMLAIMDAGILLEDELFRLAADIMKSLPGKTIAQSLELLRAGSDIVYGTGMISQRQYDALKTRLDLMSLPGRDHDQFRSDLIYITRASEWSEQNLLFHFSQTIDHFQTIETISGRYIHDRLHSSPLLLYSHILDRLTTDNSLQIGITNEIFGTSIASGIKALNPGLARGVLKEPKPGEDLGRFSKESILILPATTADLPPVSGIITAGRGNVLSHVQLLARNLGIPNVSVDRTLLEKIRAGIDKKVVLAVSPRGLVRIEKNSPEWEPVFAQKAHISRAILKADTDKLDLAHTQIISLADIRAEDSGRIAGPKAANLGELKYHFPASVTDGVVIPFGIFKKFLDRPFQDTGQNIDKNLSMFEWMKRQYQKIDTLKESPLAQRRFIKTTLAHIRAWILKTDLSDAFQQALKENLENTMGPDGSYGVFVRSDTNVEDLPGFTGAGLNLTVPHVVGFDHILTALRRVWASPFTIRAFGWRHAYLENPEHVYASVLLMKTMPVEKSGVMVTKNLDTGQEGWLTIAVNEGIGGAVSGQTAEELQVHVSTGQVTLLSQATDPLKRVVLDTGGMGKEWASGTDTVLSSTEIAQLIKLAKHLLDRFPALKTDGGQRIAADVEFGFLNDRLVLFQIRPLVDDAQTLQDQTLSHLDSRINSQKSHIVDLSRIPLQVAP